MSRLNMAPLNRVLVLTPASLNRVFTLHLVKIWRPCVNFVMELI